MAELPVLPEEIRATLPPAAVTYIVALEAAVQTLSARVAELDARVKQEAERFRAIVQKANIRPD